MSKSNNISFQEKGIAMITVMLILAVLTVLGMTMANSSIVGSYISSNYRASKEAFFDAEAGVQYALARLQKDLNNKTIAIENLDHAQGFDLDYLNLSSLRPEGFNFDYPEPLLRTGDSYCFSSRGKGRSDAYARGEIMACFAVESAVHHAFEKGIVSGGDIEVNRLTRIDGDMHSNGSIFQSGGGSPAEISGSITACGIIDAGIAKDSTGGDEPVDVPLITEQDMTGWKNKADEIFDHPEHGDIGFNQDDDLSDKVVFVQGNVIIDRAILDRTTIISTGNVYFQGSSTSGSHGTDNAVIALGYIEYKAGNETDAVFWCNGRFYHRGGVAFRGSIVSGQGVIYLTDDSGFDINSDEDLNESFGFKAAENITNPFIPVELKIDPVFWADKSLL
jgi:hypothetical protein